MQDSSTNAEPVGQQKKLACRTPFWIGIVIVVCIVVIVPAVVLTQKRGARSALSAFRAGAFCVSTPSACEEPARYVTELPRPVLKFGQNITIVAVKSCQQVFHRSDGAPCGSKTEVWTYDGSWPGPTVVALQGSTTRVMHLNSLGSDYEGNDIWMSTHHHGAHVASQHDGHPSPDQASMFGLNPRAKVTSGTSWIYELPNDQEPATLWYHDHAMHFTGRNVVMGLSGFYILVPNSDSGYNVRSLPQGEYEVVLAIQDRRFVDNQFDYPMNPRELARSDVRHNGYFGDRFIVNGVFMPFMNVKQTQYRFRILNGCNARRISLRLDRSLVFHQIGTEGGYIHSPSVREEIFMAPGERYDVVIDFSLVDVGVEVALLNTNTEQDGAASYVLLPEVMQFRVIGGATGNQSLPAVLVNLSAPSVPTVTRQFCATGGMDAPWTINDAEFSPTVVNVHVRRGTTERWTFAGAVQGEHGTNMAMPHPFHSHLVQFRIESVGGELEDGWKDTMNIRDVIGRSYIATFNGQPGVYVFHCHNLEHEDNNMMLQFMLCDDNSTFPCDNVKLLAFTEPRTCVPSHKSL